MPPTESQLILFNRTGHGSGENSVRHPGVVLLGGLPLFVVNTYLKVVIWRVLDSR